jgi:hypothetical protein
MHRGRGWVVLFVLFSLSLAAPSATAKVKSIDCGSSPGLLIDKAGTYKIRTAVNSCASSILVQISHSDVTLDLGGRMLDGHQSFCIEGIHVDDNLKRIEIRNGAIANCGDGIRSESHGPVISKVVSFDNDIGLNVKGGMFKGNLVAHSPITGMTDGGGGAYIGNTVVSSGGRGILSPGAKLIERNKIIDAGGMGIDGGSGGRIEANRLFGNSGTGVALQGGKLIGNTAIGNGNNGIETEGDPIISGNRAVANDDTGLHTEGNDAVVNGNVSLANAGHGVRVPDSADAIGNRASGNLGTGVSAGNSKVKKNTASGNVGLGINAGPSPSGLGTNKASRNGGVQCVPADLCVPDPALDGKEIIFLDCISTYDITEPGTYFLGRSVTDCGGGNAIDIESSNVTLDLRGHRIDGTLAFAAGINVFDGLTDVVVRNGTVSDYLFGVAAGDTEAVIENIVAVDNFAAGVAAGDGVRVERNTLMRTSTSGAGILMNPGATAIGNTIVANEAEGILTDNGPVTIKDNYIAGNGDAGIAYDFDPANDSTITGNKLIGNGWVSIRVGNDNTINDNIVKGSIDYPIEGGTGNTIKRNKIIGNSGGIEVDQNNVVTDNTVSGNNGRGIGVLAGSKVKDNRVIGNTGDGIGATGAVVITGNTAIGNAGAGIDADPAATGSGNTANRNGGTQCDPPTLC